MLTFLYNLFDSILHWIGLKQYYYPRQELNDAIKESLHEDIEYDKQLLERNNIYNIHIVM